MSETQPHKPTKPSPESSQPKPRQELPLVSIPDDPDTIAQDMAELFAEDQVTHQYGDTKLESV
jgi:hypothetical protein